MNLLSFPLYSCQVDRRRVGYMLVFAIALILFGFISPVSAALVPRAPLGVVWESPVAEDSLYYTEVERLVTAYEREVGQVIMPSKRAKVALKINTRGRTGLSTPLQLIRAVVEMLEARGYDRRSILIIDDSAHNLREAGVMPPLSESTVGFEGCPVLALDTEQYYDANWLYDLTLIHI